MKRRALGKGLASLIPESPAPAAPATPAEGLAYVAPESILPNRMQPRERFDEEELASLAESIRRDGLLQPILVRPLDGGYEIVAGERRWRAAMKAGLRRIPAFVQKVADDRALELALVENLQRRDLDPVEEARAFKTLAERFGLTQESIAERTGKSRPAVANALRLLKLPADVQEMLRSGAITRGHARALLALDDEEAVRALARRLGDEALSVRTAEAEVKPAARGRRREAREIDPNVKAAQDRLQSHVGTAVRIECGPGGRGRIILEFGSQEELSRIYDGIIKSTF